jgi:glucose dehydrogenase
MRVQSRRRCARHLLPGATALLAAALLTGQTHEYSGPEWAAPGGDWAATRYSPLSQIDTTNVQGLGGAWMVTLPERLVSKAPLMTISSTTPSSRST